eukprot:jgi/Botrbrau1/22422/Bobra.0091s0025.1
MRHCGTERVLYATSVPGDGSPGYQKCQGFWMKAGVKWPWLTASWVCTERRPCYSSPMGTCQGSQKMVGVIVSVFGMMVGGIHSFPAYH